MFIEMPEDNSIIRWKYKDKWKCAEISDLILSYEKQKRGECMENNDFANGYTSALERVRNEIEQISFDTNSDYQKIIAILEELD